MAEINITDNKPQKNASLKKCQQKPKQKPRILPETTSEIREVFVNNSVEVSGKIMGFC